MLAEGDTAPLGSPRGPLSMRWEHELACFNTISQAETPGEISGSFPASWLCGTSPGANPTIVGDFAWPMPLALSSNPHSFWCTEKKAATRFELTTS